MAKKIIADQSLLETVIPKAGSANKVAILKGPMRGLSGYVKELLDQYKGAIEIEGCKGEDRLVKLEYESFSKYLQKKKRLKDPVKISRTKKSGPYPLLRGISSVVYYKV